MRRPACLLSLVLLLLCYALTWLTGLRQTGRAGCVCQKHTHSRKKCSRIFSVVVACWFDFWTVLLSVNFHPDSLHCLMMLSRSQNTHTHTPNKHVIISYANKQKRNSICDESPSAHSTSKILVNKKIEWKIEEILRMTWNNKMCIRSKSRKQINDNWMVVYHVWDAFNENNVIKSYAQHLNKVERET